MTTITDLVSATESFAKATVELNNCPTKSVWYTSVEDYHTETSIANRNACEEQEARRQELLSIMASTADELALIERKIGAGRILRLAEVSGADPIVVMTMLNY